MAAGRTTVSPWLAAPRITSAVDILCRRRGLLAEAAAGARGACSVILPQAGLPFYQGLPPLRLAGSPGLPQPEALRRQQPCQTKQLGRCSVARGVRQPPDKQISHRFPPASQLSPMPSGFVDHVARPDAYRGCARWVTLQRPGKVPRRYPAADDCSRHPSSALAADPRRSPRMFCKALRRQRGHVNAPDGRVCRCCCIYQS